MPKVHNSQDGVHDNRIKVEDVQMTYVYDIKDDLKKLALKNAERTHSRGNNMSPKSEKQEVEIRRDKEGHLIYSKGDVLFGEYELISTLGKGTFGKVVEARNIWDGSRVAIKIVRSTPKYMEDAKVEVSILESINRVESRRKIICVEMLDWFIHHGHVCMVFEKFGQSLLDFMERNHYYRFPLEDVSDIAHQLVCGINFLHDNGLIHTDLKLENILFVNSSSTCYKKKIIDGKEREIRRVMQTDIKIIDFGGVSFHRGDSKRMISTCYYRAPEVTLGLKWSYPSDVWSLGCIIFELATGNILFQAKNELERLVMMEKILEPLPRVMVSNSPMTKFFKEERLDWDKESSRGKELARKCKPLLSYRLSNSAREMYLFRLIDKMLMYRPSRRITCAEALEHQFFDQGN